MATKAPHPASFDADAAWAELRGHKDKLDEAMITDRAAIPAAKAAHDAAAPALRLRIRKAQEAGYEPEGLPRTYKAGGMVRRGYGKARGA